LHHNLLVVVPVDKYKNQVRAYFHSFAAVLLVMTISAAKAVPVYGTFSGFVTYSAKTGDGYYYYPDGTPVTGTYEYTPTLLTGGSTEWADPTAHFQININGKDLLAWSGNNLNLSVDANGVPLSGNGDGAFDLFLGTSALGDVGMTTGYYIVDAQVTYSTPSSTPATVPDIASTSCLTGIAMLSLAVFGRFAPKLRKVQPSAR
jgi:hypothetical protein